MPSLGNPTHGPKYATTAIFDHLYFYNRNRHVSRQAEALFTVSYLANPNALKRRANVIGIPNLQSAIKHTYGL